MFKYEFNHKIAQLMFSSSSQKKTLVEENRLPAASKPAEELTVDLSTFPKNMLDVIKYVVDSLKPGYPSALPFALKNQSVLNMAKHLKRHKTASTHSMVVYTCYLRRFCEWYGVEPDKLVSEFHVGGEVSAKAVNKFLSVLDDYVGILQSEGASPKSIDLAVQAVRTFLKANGIYVPTIPKPQVYIKYRDRAPTQEELAKLIEIADLREKVMISMLALGGFRLGTLLKLKYRHVKRDLEENIVPVHVHVEAEITKGKYADYDTFIGEEAVQYLKLYLEQRRKGTADIPPETITDESPLIRSKYSPKPLTPQQAYALVHDLYVRAGIVMEKNVRRFDVRVHSLRKYFRTQMFAAGVPSEYIEYMMGHKISTYLDIRMKGVEFLRNIYRSANISIKSRTRATKVEMLKEIIRGFGYDPEKILVKEALAEPHRTAVGEDPQILELRKLLKEIFLNEVLGYLNNGGRQC
ncbi:MAG: tyrosine-type recombinase/integrase [Nitrososphaeria archaeon]